MTYQPCTPDYARCAPDLNDVAANLVCAHATPRALIKETREVVDIARRFNKEVVRPYALELDRKLHEDPDFLPWDFVKKANDWGFYTMWIPRLFGGKGYFMHSMSAFVEEIGSACTAMANLIGVHYLGMATLAASWNAPLMMKIFRDVAAGEKAGDPRIISLAITEPSAGTDVEEPDLIDKGNITCHAKKVDGGYVVNGTKIFISNGHLSKWHVVIAYSDLDLPSQNTVCMLVQTGQKGFSFGRHEKKMGQRACPASELVFKDCFVPDNMVALDPEQIKDLKRDAKHTFQQVLDYVLGATRAGVAAFATGAARGAYEEALAFANETEVDGRLLANHEWAQCMLAEMYKNVNLARLAYMETNHHNASSGIYKSMLSKGMFQFSKYAPQFFVDKIAPTLLGNSLTTKWLRKQSFDSQPEDEMRRTSGWGSLAKFSGTDLGMKNCHMALELMGQAGLRHDQRVEKHFRDAKLLQIYEGTNQLNRLNLFKCLISRACPQSCVFHDA
ncbi:acyl-CoA dehydrogenase family protein [Desulfatibacillum aliphaticivorans]|uniref:acyl-CoA dehydrogenase family protein n=1 Tax=Desulfatibacillum aliphaticivorans TaxID=218208 RepID=UPI000484B9F3|nr:acyl-CoA dehydrogenase family protein [Desulfatibacillum aliphaticivorans]